VAQYGQNLGKGGFNLRAMPHPSRRANPRQRHTIRRLFGQSLAPAKPIPTSDIQDGGTGDMAEESSRRVI
jgi:hypothetical protein